MSKSLLKPILSAEPGNTAAQRALRTARPASFIVQDGAEAMMGSLTLSAMKVVLTRTIFIPGITIMSCRVFKSLARFYLVTDSVD